jgi:predicted flap endonuclease-1-like 5' DNA nuclease
LNHKGTCPSCDPTVDLAEINAGEEYYESVDLQSLDGIGQKAASNLRRAGYDTVEDIADASNDDLLDVKWVGEKGLFSLRERAKQLDPQLRWQ